MTRPLERSWFPHWTRGRYERELRRYRRDQLIDRAIRIAVALAVIAVTLYVLYLFTTEPGSIPVEPGSSR